MERLNWKAGNMLYPVPVVLVTCKREGERPNIVTVAWAGTVCSDPPMLSISLRPDRYSHEIIKETGNFVVNLTTKEMVRAVDYCGVVSGRDVDKFQKTGLTPISLTGTGIPGIAESPVQLLCRTEQVIPLGSHDLFLARILRCCVDGTYEGADGRFALEKANPIVYSHGKYYDLKSELGAFGFSVRKNKRKSEKGEKKNES